MSFTPGPWHSLRYAGLTKREEFAKAAMQGIIAASRRTGGVFYDEEFVAENAVKMANALIAALNAEPQP